MAPQDGTEKRDEQLSKRTNEASARQRGSTRRRFRKAPPEAIPELVALPLLGLGSSPPAPWVALVPREACLTRVGGRREQDALLIDAPVTVRTGPSARAAAGSGRRRGELPSWVRTQRASGEETSCTAAGAGGAGGLTLVPTGVMD